jgi:hypothetical protein
MEECNSAISCHNKHNHFSWVNERPDDYSFISNNERKSIKPFASGVTYDPLSEKNRIYQSNNSIYRLRIKMGHHWKKLIKKSFGKEHGWV